MLIKSVFNWWKPLSAAAVVAFLTVCGLYWYELNKSVHYPIEIVYLTDKATDITLSDGTIVWMCANSQIRYQETFTGKNRDVFLEGEAFFEVAHNSKQPFRVTAGGQIVEALGTSFNVRAFPEEQTVKVALVKGSVRVTDDKTVHTVILEPSQEATIEKSIGSIKVIDGKSQQIKVEQIVTNEATAKITPPIAVKDVDINNIMSWKTGKYVFDNVEFKDIVKILERGFGVNIHIENENLKNKPYTMRFENGESLEKILDLIQINAKYSYQYKNGEIVIN